jgi:predicted negative regulator of RcsB-dependent stress response
MMEKFEEFFSEHFAELVCVVSLAFIVLIGYGLVMS